MNKTLFLFFFLIIQSLFSQKAKWEVSPPYNIKTLWIDNHKRPFFSNIISLNSHFSISFDDLQADEKEYYYKIIRLDEQWKESILQESEYIEGFDSDIITNIKQSVGTLQSYTHYQVDFPNENTRIFLSGNYAIQILDEAENLVFSKTFILYEKKLEAGIQVKWPENISIQDEKQQVDFFLYPGNMRLQNESQNLTIILLQNMDWNTQKIFHAPTFYQGNKWIYHFPQYSIFDGLNEFRRFETKDLRGMNYNVVKRIKTDKLFDFYLYTDFPKHKYTYYKDADGIFFILSQQAVEDVDTEADYVYVHFSLKKDYIKEEKVYIVGRFNDFQPDNELIYNPENHLYETSILMKQGYYEYFYLQKNQSVFSSVPIEGNFSETENRYDLLIYYKAPGKRYTEVIGYANTNSSYIK